MLSVAGKLLKDGAVYRHFSYHEVEQHHALSLIGKEDGANLIKKLAVFNGYSYEEVVENMRKTLLCKFPHSSFELKASAHSEKYTKRIAEILYS